MYISAECFGGFWEIIADSGTGFVKPANLPSEHPDLLFIQPLGHSLAHAYRIVKDYPDVLLALFGSKSVYPVVFQQRFANHILKRVEEVVGEGMDEAVVLLEMFIPAERRKFGYDNITIFKINPVHMVGRNHGADFFHLHNLPGGIESFPGLVDDFFISGHVASFLWG
jgi:hypothetical protein